MATKLTAPLLMCLGLPLASLSLQCILLKETQGKETEKPPHVHENAGEKGTQKIPFLPLQSTITYPGKLTVIFL